MKYSKGSSVIVASLPQLHYRELASIIEPLNIGSNAQLPSSEILRFGTSSGQFCLVTIIRIEGAQHITVWGSWVLMRLDCGHTKVVLPQLGSAWFWLG